jgi:hypothetical protein
MFIQYSVQYLSEIFLIQRRTVPDMMENVYYSPCKITIVPFRIIGNLNFVVRFSKKNTRKSNLMKIHSMGGELLHADRQTDRRDLAKSRLPQFFKKRLKTQGKIISQNVLIPKATKCKKYYTR